MNDINSIGPNIKKLRETAETNAETIARVRRLNDKLLNTLADIGRIATNTR